MSRDPWTFFRMEAKTVSGEMLCSKQLLMRDDYTLSEFEWMAAKAGKELARDILCKLGKWPHLGAVLPEGWERTKIDDLAALDRPSVDQKV